MTSLTTDELVHILHVALEEIRHDVDANLLATKLLCLTTAYEHPGLQQADIAKYVKDLSLSSASRHVLDWSDYDRYGNPSVGYLSQVPNPANRRRNMLFVTPKGQQYLTNLTERVNKALQKRAARAASA